MCLLLLQCVVVGIKSVKYSEEFAVTFVLQAPKPGNNATILRDNLRI